MNDQKQQIVEKLKSATNILVTVNANPSLDGLAACIGLSLILNKLDKHATAVFSGEVPSNLDFLKPEKTIEKTTDSLRDFIISLDKSKADKLRYKVEDEVVKIFITPYRTSITERDLVFGQGDFNVDVVLGIGVHRQQDLDTAITAHGRILHDATVICINNTPETELGTINWLDLSASSLSEMVASMADDLGANVLDQQNATALLTGIVAQTNHFGNERTTPRTMTVSARLLEAGADQRLVADQLSDVLAKPNDRPAAATAARPNDTLDITHAASTDSPFQPAPPQNTDRPTLANDQSKPADALSASYPNGQSGPLSAGTALNANVIPSNKVNESAVNPLDLPSANTPILSHDADRAKTQPAAALPEPVGTPLDALRQPIPSPAQPSAVQAPAQLPPQEPEGGGNASAFTDTLAGDQNAQTLSELEKLVHSPHVAADDVDSARKAVEDALKVTPADAPLEPLAALNAHPVNLNLGHDNEAAPAGPDATENQKVAADQKAAESSGPAVLDPRTFQPLSGPAPAVQPELPTYSLPAQPFLAPASQVNNEPAPLTMSPADQPFTMPLPPSISVPGPQLAPPTSVGMPPQGPPPPPTPPPMMPPNFGDPNTRYPGSV